MRAPGGRGELSISGPYLGLASGRARGTAVPSFLHLSMHPSIPPSLQPFVSPAASSAVPAASTPASPGLGPVCPRAAPQAPRVWRLPWGSQIVPRRAHREQPPPPPVPEPSLPRPAPAAGQRWPVPRSPRGHLASPPRRSRGLCCHPPTSLAPFLPARGLCGASALIPDCHRHTHPSPALSLPLRPNSCCIQLLVIRAPERSVFIQTGSLPPAGPSPRWAGALRGLQLPTQPQQCASSSCARAAVLCGYPRSGGFCCAPLNL